MITPNHFTFVCRDTGDTYNVTLTDDGEFSHAVRFMTGVGGKSVVYDSFFTLPPQHQQAIEWQLLQRKRRK